jgi:diadenosine tetraphosphate (Ap4A) HIT family hydrolase
LFILDARLQDDAVFVGEMPLSRVLLMNDRRFPWAVLVPRRAGVAEFHDLAAADRAALAEEIAALSAALQKLTRAGKMNVGALGNIVRQLHIHVVARHDNDGAWPGPVWGAGERRPYEAGEAEAFAAALKAALAI